MSKSIYSAICQYREKNHNLLLEKNLISKYSVSDILMHLTEIRKVQINDEWNLAEITGKTQKLLEKLNVHIT